MLGGCPVRNKSMSLDLRLVLTTCASLEVADRLALALVEQRLAACVNVLPGVHSTYRWLGKIERDDEVLVVIKTVKTKLAAIETSIKTISGYEVPEVLALEIAGGAADYLSWLEDSMQGDPG
jgi:periplasmic divalent cation tolerance protein